MFSRLLTPAFLLFALQAFAHPEVEKRQSCPGIHVFGARETTAPPGYGTSRRRRRRPRPWRALRRHLRGDQLPRLRRAGVVRRRLPTRPLPSRASAAVASCCERVQHPVPGDTARARRVLPGARAFNLFLYVRMLRCVRVVSREARSWTTRSAVEVTSTRPLVDRDPDQRRGGQT